MLFNQERRCFNQKKIRFNQDFGCRLTFSSKIFIRPLAFFNFMKINKLHIMKQQNTLSWPQRILLMVGSVLLLWSSYRLSYHAFQQILEVFTGKHQLIDQLFTSVGMIVVLALALLLALAAYLINAFIWGLPVPFPANEAIDDSPEDADSLQIQIGARNTYLLLLAALGSYYMLFLQQSQHVDFYWVLCFPVFILLVNWQSARRQVYAVLAILGIMGFICLIKLNTLYNANLLSTVPLFISASLLSYALIGLWVYYHVKRVAEDKSLLEYRLLLTFLLGTLCIIYFHSMLSIINCRYDPRKDTVSYPAIVMQKCPPYGDYTLSISYYKDKAYHGMLLPVSAKAYHAIKEGDTLTLRLHPGLFGWPWYHDGLGMRQAVKKQTTQKP